ncbi:MAG: hypothetical protein KatS3mg097_042 [Candidatus Parcubacteria bacterium]|nr:MAG: hypothetical protein KatS3mg097_042 [Candidatus Parcubacteria bacterium]
MDFGKGENQFIQRLNNLQRDNKEPSPTKEQINIDKNNLREKINHTLEKIKEELGIMPEISREAKFHQDQKQIIEQYKDVLAEAINASLNEDLLKGFQMIKNMKNPFLLDAFHAMMADHFYKLLDRQNEQ